MNGQLTRRLHFLRPLRLNREQAIRLTIALVFVTAMIAFYAWFIATHLERID